MKFKYKKEVAVGLSLVIATVILVFGVRYFQDLPIFRGTYQLHTSFENANGLMVGNPVLIQGVRAGAVDAVTLDPAEQNVRVTFHIDEGITIPEGSQVEITGIAALNSLHLDVRLGPPGASPLQPGSYVPPARGGDLIGDLTSRAPALVDDVEQLLATTNRAMTEAQTLFDETGEGVPQTLASFRETAHTLNQLLRAEERDISLLLDNLNSVSAELGRVATNVNGLVDENEDTLAVAVQDLRRTLQRLDRTLEELDPAVVRLNEVIAKIDRGEGTLGLLVNDPSLYLRLDSAAGNLNAVLTDFERNPRRYLRELKLIDIF